MMMMMIWSLACVVFALGSVGLAGVQPPPWADIRRNPCAARPRGWLMLYWPPEDKCYTIYKKGHPCSDTQELSPAKKGGRIVAECTCPPGTAQLPHTAVCHQLFQRGPCVTGEYFAPVEQSFNKGGERQGMCTRPPACEDETLIYWPPDGRCYFRLSQGPCYPGSVFDLRDDGLPECVCNTSSSHYAGLVGGCFAHYTRGPCERGQIFLPGGQCGCEPHLPHYHADTGTCYELDTPGPCPRGHLFAINANESKIVRANCNCKAFHARWVDGVCYRLYSRGPCDEGEMIIEGGKCTKVPCSRGRLYVPSRRRCYPAGASGPCPPGARLGFDLESRPASDGLSHNGVCTGTKQEVISCSSRNGAVIYKGVCHIQYTRGPCEDGFWITKDENGSAKCEPKTARIASHVKMSRES